MKPLQVQTRPSNCHTSSVRIKNDSPSGKKTVSPFFGTKVPISYKKNKLLIFVAEIEGDEDFTSEPDDSNDSWAMTEEFSTDFILRYRNRYIKNNFF